jgi:serine/threonine protein kinase/tetratricopeptide (TPR) repeat protein
MMSDPIITIFGEALEKSPNERETFLRRRCGGDDELFRRVQALLAAHEDRENVIPKAGDDPTSTTSGVPAAETTRIGTWIGRYHLLAKIGEGGMGEVFLAEQSQPFRRRVAVKIVRRGMDTREVIARFETERQALALMDHPNVARVLDAGATPDGRPFFVMEHVPGIPITEYCDQYRLTTAERLHLFAQVCQAVQHAHQKGIIHRDIKPSNVLVTVNDDQPLPKVIDFGVAKATGHRLTEGTFITHVGQLVGTPEYMSPEQAEMTALDVDTRTDIYSLGVLLFELLTGALPFERGTLRQAALAGILRVIREQEPPKPSTRLSSLGAESTEIAKKRRTTRATLLRELRGDLDWIALKALEKDRTRRYGTAAELADDVHRHLHHEPVRAGPPSVTYRVRKFVRRNTALVAGVAGVVLALSAGVTTTSTLYFKTEVLRRQAETQKEAATRERERAVEAEQLAQERLRDADAVKGFVLDMLATVDAGAVFVRGVTVREILEYASRKVDSAFADQPLVEAELRTTIGNAFRGLGMDDLANPHLTRAFELFDRTLDSSDPRRLTAVVNYAGFLNVRGRYPEAEQLLRAAIDAAERAAATPAQTKAELCGLLGAVLLNQRNLEEAEPLIDASVTALSGVSLTHESVGLQRLAWLAHFRKEKDNADRLAHQAVARARESGDAHILGMGLVTLSSVLEQRGEYGAAEQIVRELRQMNENTLGQDHPNTISIYHRLAWNLYLQGRYDEAAPLYAEAIASYRRILGDESYPVAHTFHALAVLRERQGDFQDAERLCRQALTRKRMLRGDDHPDVASCAGNLGLILTQLGRHEEGESLLRECVRKYREAGNPLSPLAGCILGLGIVLRERRAFAEAEPLVREALELDRTSPTIEVSRLREAANEFATLLRMSGRENEAVDVLRDELARRKEQYGPRSREAAAVMQALGSALAASGDEMAAEAVLGEAVALWESAWGPHHPAGASARSDLGECLAAQGKYEDAETLLLEAHADLSKTLSPRHPKVVQTVKRLVELYVALGQPERAVQWSQLLAE